MADKQLTSTMIDALRGLGHKGGVQGYHARYRGRGVSLNTLKALVLRGYVRQGDQTGSWDIANDYSSWYTLTDLGKAKLHEVDPEALIQPVEAYKQQRIARVFELRAQELARYTREYGERLWKRVNEIWDEEKVVKNEAQN